MQLTQGELFDKTIEDKILSLQKWMGRLEKQLWFLKNVHEMRQQQKNVIPIIPEKQMDFFTSSSIPERQSLM